MLNVTTDTWTQIRASSPSPTYFNSSWSGTYGTEDAANWPSARTRTAITRDLVNRNYVYMFGGSAQNRENPLGDLWRFNMQTRRWALIAGPAGNTAFSWANNGAFESGNRPPGMWSAQMQPDKTGQYLWLFSGSSVSDQPYSSTWCFRLADGLWARALSPYSRFLPSILYGPPYWPQTYGTMTWSYNSTVYEFGGLETNRNLGPDIGFYRRVIVWRIDMSVGQVSFPFPLQLPSRPAVLEPSQTTGATVSVYFNSTWCPRGRNDFVAFPAETLIFSENVTGPVVNYDWGISSTPVNNFARPTCFVLETAGYYWSNISAPQLMKVKALADDGVQLEWRKRGVPVLFNSVDFVATAWADHGLLLFEALVVVYPGPNWFRYALSFFFLIAKPISHFDIQTFLLQFRRTRSFLHASVR
jgi:hypothetical protein